MNTARPYDIVLFGATGFTGGMTAEYLARNAPAELSWAIAGRDEDKLLAVKSRLESLNPACERVACISADVNDGEGLRAMSAQARVLLTTVGPFVDYGQPVVDACLATSTDYVDSTGEPRFVQHLLDQCHDEAREKRMKLVSCCGFDAIPADLGAYFTVQQLPPNEPIDMCGYLAMRAHFSGGTERSAIKAFTPLPPHQAYGEGSDGQRRARALPARIHFCPELGAWATPFPTVDAAIVRRSATSLAVYGPDFTYRHHAEQPSWPVMASTLLFFGGVATLARITPLRNIMLQAAKKPGQGPSAAQMDEAWFKLHIVTRCAEKTWVTEVAGGDPGYRETSKMLAHSAMCLALDRDALPDAYGALTPAQAMAEPLLARLRRAGLRFSVLSAGLRATA